MPDTRRSPVAVTFPGARIAFVLLFLINLLPHGPRGCRRGEQGHAAVSRASGRSIENRIAADEAKLRNDAMTSHQPPTWSLTPSLTRGRASAAGGGSARSAAPVCVRRVRLSAKRVGDACPARSERGVCRDADGD